MRPRRNPLDKEKFGEGNRQKWAAIFTAIGVAVMIIHAYGILKDPAPFLQFFLSIGVTFILGASATAVMNSWKVSSLNRTENETLSETRAETINENIQYTEKVVRPRDFAGEDLE